MHHALELLEILEQIFALIGHRATLACLARTCKTFKEPALDALWKKLVSLEPLLRCLPRDSWGDSENEQDTIVMLRPLRKSDWIAAKDYARRVKWLYFQAESSQLNLRQYLRAIEECFPVGSACLLPNIRTLFWAPGGHHSHSGRDLARTARPFLGPLLRELSLYISPESHSFYAQLPFDFSTLERLSVHVLRPWAMEGTSLPVVMALTRVRHLEIPWLNDEAFEHISHIPFLETLEISSAQAWTPCPRSPSQTSHVPPFSALGRLCLQNANADVARNIIATCPLWSLQSLVISLTSPTIPWRTIARLYAAIGATVSATTLTKLYLGKFRAFHAPASEESRSNYAVQGAALRPLFQFSKLKSVTLHTTAGFDLDDTVIWEMAKAWPLATSIDISSGSTISVSPSITIDALRAFSLHCPVLVNLTLEFDATIGGGSYLTSPTTQCVLTSLGVMRSPIADPSTVKAFLLRVFPRLTAIILPPSYPDLDMYEEAERDRLRNWINIGAWLKAADRLAERDLASVS
ncbi:hypothetical protein MKEN_00182000 [Mycena kentingensis (nom. inval.)]|nr:hypothetical protein MKEN_00182000 [Mycena kentingensis (nom. inval.)]